MDETMAIFLCGVVTGCSLTMTVLSVLRPSNAFCDGYVTWWPIWRQSPAAK